MIEARADKLVTLSEFCDLETGEIDPREFGYKSHLFLCSNVEAQVFFIAEKLWGVELMLVAALKLSGLESRDCWWSDGQNVKQELDEVRPKLIIALGAEAKEAIQKLQKKVLCIKHPASFRYAAPERRVNWIIKLSLEIDKGIKHD